MSPTLSFEHQCQRSRGLLYWRALRLTRNPADAEDLVQSALIKAWNRYETFSEERSFLTWMSAIMLRTFLDRRRADGRRIPTTSLETLITQGEEDSFDRSLSLACPDAEAAFLSKLSQEQLLVAFAELPASHRRLICLHELHGMSYEECARAEGVAVGTVRSRLFRARERLRATLKANCAP